MSKQVVPGVTGTTLPGIYAESYPKLVKLLNHVFLLVDWVQTYCGLVKLDKKVMFEKSNVRNPNSRQVEQFQRPRTAWGQCEGQHVCWVHPSPNIPNLYVRSQVWHNFTDRARTKCINGINFRALKLHSENAISRLCSRENPSPLSLKLRLVQCKALVLS